MRITRTSMFTGVRHTFELPITLLEYAAWERGTPIQKAMPGLTDDEREFVMTGVTATEMREAFERDERDLNRRRQAYFNRSQGEGDE